MKVATFGGILGLAWYIDPRVEIPMPTNLEATIGRFLARPSNDRHAIAKVSLVAGADDDVRQTAKREAAQGQPSHDDWLRGVLW